MGDTESWELGGGPLVRERLASYLEEKGLQMLPTVPQLKLVV